MKNFLENLEIGEGKVKLSNEEIKSILTEHGKTITNETEKVRTELNKEIDNYKTTVTNLENQIETMPNSDELDKLKKEIQDMKEAESQRKADEKVQKEKSIREERTNAFFNEVKFASESAKAGVIAQFNEKDFKYDEESQKFQGASEWLEELKENDTGAFVSEVANPKYTTIPTAPTSDSSMDELKEAFGLPNEQK